VEPLPVDVLVNVGANEGEERAGVLVATPLVEALRVDVEVGHEQEHRARTLGYAPLNLVEEKAAEPESLVPGLDRDETQVAAERERASLEEPRKPDRLPLVHGHDEPLASVERTLEIAAQARLGDAIALEQGQVPDSGNKIRQIAHARVAHLDQGRRNRERQRCSESTRLDIETLVAHALPAMLPPRQAAGNFAHPACRPSCLSPIRPVRIPDGCASLPFVRQAVFLLATVSTAAAFLCPACDSTQPAAGQLLLSWTFADGRPCTEAGVPFVYVGPPAADTYTRLDCASGLGQAVDAGRFPPGPLDIEAVSTEGAPLYRASAQMPAGDPAMLSVVLVFVGGVPGP
jgi:hypothetical protein